MMTKHSHILATLGPSSREEDRIEALINAGAGAFRINFSHADADYHRQTIRNVRAVATRMGRQIAVLQDLQGPKIRIGDMAAPVQLVIGQTLMLDNNPAPGNATRVHLPHPEILASLQVGDSVFVNDGIIRLNITARTDEGVQTTVIAGGQLSSRKGVNVPGRRLPMSALTPKDHTDLATGLEIGVDWVALSFVQHAADVEEARQIIGDRAKIMSKIETQAAVMNIESIIHASDGIMIARGDLGVELPAEDLPPLQRRMIALCREIGKPVVVATQMLESMIQNPVPTRAEASDVATAAYEGADCLMLSAESASGNYPVEAVAMMDRIIRKVEESCTWEAQQTLNQPSSASEAAIRDSVTSAAYQLSKSIRPACIVTFTETGGTPQRMARWRPNIPILCLTAHASVARQLALLWGTHTILTEPLEGTETLVEAAIQAAKSQGYAKPGDQVVVLAGLPVGRAGSTNMLRVVQIPA